jgi:hypothetical protein
MQDVYKVNKTITPYSMAAAISAAKALSSSADISTW